MSLEEAILSGYAPDGGLYVPESLPQLSAPQLQAWASLSYPRLVEELLKLFASPEDLTHQEIHGTELHLSDIALAKKGSVVCLPPNPLVSQLRGGGGKENFVSSQCEAACRWDLNPGLLVHSQMLSTWLPQHIV